MKLRVGPVRIARWGEGGHSLRYGGVGIAVITKHRVFALEFNHEWRRSADVPRNA